MAKQVTKCLVMTPRLTNMFKEFHKIPGFEAWEEAHFKAAVEIWQNTFNKNEDDIPANAKELANWWIDHINKDSSSADNSQTQQQEFSYGRYAKDGYEVSSAGDKRFSALYAKFKPGTIIEGVDVGGMSIEDVYQKIIKKSGKGKTPGNLSKLFAPAKIINNDVRFINELKKLGRYPKTSESIPDEIRQKDRSRKDINKITKKSRSYNIFQDLLDAGKFKAITKDLVNELDISEKTKFELLDLIDKYNKDYMDPIIQLDRFNTKSDYEIAEMANLYRDLEIQRANLLNKISKEIWDVELGYEISRYSADEKFDSSNPDLLNTKEELEDYSYQVGYLPLWREWAKQNPKLIEELRELAKGKTLTDKFANTRVSQARALAQILNETKPSNTQASTKQEEATTPVKTTRDIISAEQQAELSQDTIRNVFKNGRQRRDRVNDIGRQFSQLASSEVNNYIIELKQLADAGNEVAKQALANFDRQKFVAEHHKEILDRLRKKYTPVNASVKALTMYYKLMNQKHGTPIPSAEDIKKESDYKTIEYQKIYDNFYYLLSEAIPLISTLEGIIIDVYNNEAVLNTSDTVLEQSDKDPDNPQEDNTSGDSENNVKDNWMTKARTTGERDTLSVFTRKLFMSLPKIGYDGKIETDDMGKRRYLEADKAHHVLMSAISRKCNKPYEMMDVLRELQKDYIWVKVVLDALEYKDSDTADERLQKRMNRAKFYMDMNKEFNAYRAEFFDENEDGTITAKTKDINSKPDIAFVLNTWRDNIESGNRLINYLSIYNEDGDPDLSEENKKLRFDEITGINTKLDHYKSTREQRQAGINRAVLFFTDEQDGEKNIDDVHRITRMLGIEIPKSEMVESLSKGDNLEVFLSKAKFIFNHLNEVKVKDDGQGGYIYEDILNNFNKVSKEIVTVLNYIPDNAPIQNFRENGKNYTSHTAPSYKGRVMKALKENDEKFIAEQFTQIDWFYDESGWNSDWLEQLITRKAARDIFEIKTVLHSDKKEFNDMDDKAYYLSMITEFNISDDGNTAFYPVPLQADVDSNDYIKFYKYSNEEVIKKISKTVFQEYKRIQLVEKRSDPEFRKNNPNFKVIAYYDIEFKDGKPKGVIVNDDGVVILRQDGAEFKFFPQLNQKMVEIDGKKMLFIEAIRYLSSKNDHARMHSLVELTVRDLLEEKFKDDFIAARNAGLFEKTKDQSKYKYFPNAKTDNDVENNFRNFVYNYAHAYTQMVEIFTTDLAFYKDANEFQKRFKEVYAMTLRPYYESESEGKITNIILEDQDMSATISREMNEIADYAFRNGLISKEEAKYIKDSAKSTFEATDGQAFRSLKSFKKMLESIGEWTKEAERAYNNLKEVEKYNREHNYAYNHPKAKKVALEDQRVIFQTVKPFVFGREIIDSGIDGKKISKPMQFKNSEALLLTIFGPQSKSVKLRALIRFIDDEINNIDVIQFASCGKTGNQGTIKLDPSLQTEDEYINALTEAVKIKEAVEFDKEGNPTKFQTTTQNNPSVIHELSADDWGIVAGNPEHLLDAEVLFGTQIRKLISADIPVNTMFSVRGYDKPMSLTEIVKQYSRLSAANALKGFAEVHKEIKDPKQLERILQKELASNNRYDSTLKEACKLVDDGQGGKMFNLPIYDPIQSIRIQNLLNSIIKKATVKQKIKGGSTTQASSFGVDDTLNVRFLNSEGEFIFNESEFLGVEKVNKDHIKLLKEKKQQYATYEEYRNDNQAASEAYWEVYMPVWDERLFELCADENGQLDINKLPNELRYGVSFRIPTEDKYSMQRFYVKDFLPSNTGSQMLWPNEIVLITGADFDVDHNYNMMKDFYYGFDAKKAFSSLSRKEREMWMGDDTSMNEASNALFGEDEDSNTPWGKWLNYLRENDPESYNNIVNNKEYWSVRINKANDKKSLLDQHKTQINNSLLDIVEAVLQSPAVAARQINPGNFDENKRVMYLIEIAKKVDIDTYEKEVIGHENDVKYLKELYEKHRGIVDPTSVRAQIGFHSANSNGGKMIGIYANNNTSHAIMQGTKLSLAKPISINGRTYQSLHSMYASDDKGRILFYISKNLASFINASVDNVKAPTLTALNQNQFTVNVSTLLLRLGMPIQTVGLLLNQSAILEATRRYNNNLDRGKNAKAILQEVRKEYTGGETVSTDIVAQASELREDILIKSIIHFNGVEEASEKSKDIYNAVQRAIIDRFIELYEIADDLSKITNAFRADTSNGSNGPSIAKTLYRERRIEKLDEIESIINIPKAVDFVRNIDGTINLDKTLDSVVDSSIPIVNAFTVASIYGSEEILKDLFPHFKADIKEALDLFDSELKSDVVLSDKIVNKFIEHLFLYSLMRVEEIATIQITGESQRRNLDGTKAYFYGTEYNGSKANFIDDFIKEKKNNEELRDNEFIKQLIVVRKNKRNKQPRIKFNNVGSLTQDQKAHYMADWESLLYSPNRRTQIIGLNLFRYCIFNQGLNFGPESFIHLASTVIRKMFPGYVDSIRSIMESKDDYAKFVYQFMRNNLYNSQICPVISPTSSHIFANKDGEVYDEISLNVHSKSDYVDKTIVLRDGYVNGLYSPTFHKFISTNVNGKVVFYRYVDSVINSDMSVTAKYKKIDPLGGFEYQYGIDESAMQSMISKDAIVEKNSGTSEYARSQREAQESMTDNNSYHMESSTEDYFFSEYYSQLNSKSDKLSDVNPESREDATGKKPCR